MPAATNQLTGVILSAPAVEPDPELATPLLKAACRILGRFLPKVPIEEIKAAALSRDLAVVDMYENDPLVFHGHCLARWGAEMLNAMDASMGKASKATAPLLAIHGSEDRVVGIDGTRKVLATWGGPTAVEIVEGVPRHVQRAGGGAGCQMADGVGREHGRVCTWRELCGASACPI